VTSQSLYFVRANPCGGEDVCSAGRSGHCSCRRPDGTLAPGTADAYARYTDHHFGTLSLSGTPPDYLRVGQMRLKGGELDGVRILGSKTVDLMRQNHLPLTYVIMAQLMPNDAALMQRVETLICQAIVD
jgi:hypothetical protein